MRTLTFDYIIGSGAMGTVYHAELRAPGGFRRPCAVKVMKTSSPDHEHFMARMRDEARLLGMLQDEQILGVSELVQVEGRDAVIMEFVEGLDLLELVSQGPVPPRALAELGAELAGTLHRAHKAVHPSTRQPLNVIHRDVKPANVMVTSRGGVRLLDFGVARAAFDSRESHTQGLVLGTLNYFPPEILAGGDPSPAVDVYGLGLTLWECATAQEWGSPRVQQHRFERRVDTRLAAIQEEYRALIPVLRQILQWDPNLRPDGGVVERALLHAADSATGEGLRTWARKVVPEILQQRQAKGMRDGLVGRTLEVHSLGTDEAEAPAPPSPVLGSYDDLGPPAASVRPAEPRDSEPPPPAQPASRPRQTRKKKGGGLKTALLVLGGSVILGGALGLFLLVMLGVVLWMVM